MRSLSISARRSCLETNAVFSFDTGTDNSLGKRATSSIYLSMYNSSFSKASVLVAMYAFYLKHYVYTGAQARRPMPHATSPMSHAFIPPDARSTFIKANLEHRHGAGGSNFWQPYRYGCRGQWPYE